MKKEEYRDYLESQLKQLSNQFETVGILSNSDSIEIIKLTNYLMKELYLLDNES